MSYAALPVLRTPRLTLRPLADTDADVLARGIGNFDVSKWLAVVPYPYSVRDSEAFIRKVRASGEKFWAICDAEGLQGVISLTDELAYWLARPVWGRGYGFEAAHAVISHWFSDPKAGDLASGYFQGNVASGRLLTALGFRLASNEPRFARSFSQNVGSHQMVLTRDWWQTRQTFTLYTPRLAIRAMKAADTKDLCAMAVPELARNMSSIPVGMTYEDAGTYISESQFKGIPGFRLAIEMNGRMVGGLGFGGTPLNIAYFLAPDHWGQGLATEALSAVLPELFQRFPISRIAAEHFEDNPASGAVLKKFGFVETGRDTGTSKARLEPAPVITYAVTRETLKVPL